MFGLEIIMNYEVKHEYVRGKTSINDTTRLLRRYVTKFNS